MKTKMSSDAVNFSGLELNLLTVHMTTMKNQLRLRLLRMLMDHKLATRDIFYFVKGQADQRIYNKIPDWRTIQPAMVAKISVLSPNFN